MPPLLAPIVTLFIVSAVTNGQDYQGAYLGKLNTYAHQVTGEVYAIDEHTFFIKNFFYDGLGQGKKTLLD